MIYKFDPEFGAVYLANAPEKFFDEAIGISDHVFMFPEDSSPNIRINIIYEGRASCEIRQGG